MFKSLTSWRLVVLTLVVSCIGIAPAFWLLWPKWLHSFSYSHGLLVVPLCAWLLWEQRDRINAEPAERTLLAGVPLLGLLFVWTLSFAASIEIGTSATMPLILLFAILFTAGRRITLIAAFPLLLLYSVIPVWDYINGYLQSMTTTAVTQILGVLRVPTYIQGNVVQIPSGVFEIAGGCSGLHFFIVGVTLAAVYGYQYLRSLRSQLILLAVVVGMSIVMNWVRVATIIVAGHLTDMQSFLVQIDHYYFGWALFAVLLVPFFMFAHWLESREAGPDKTTAAVAPTSSPVPATSVALICVVVLLPILVWGRLVQNEPSPVVIELPAIAGWQGPAEHRGDWEPVFRGADGETLAAYEKNGRSVDVYVNWYQSESQGRELIGSGNRVAGDKLQPRYDRKYVDAARRNDAKLPEIREIMTSSGARGQRLIWYYFLVGDQAETSPLRAKLRQGLRSFVSDGGTGLVSLSVKCELEDTDCANARQVLEEEFSGMGRTISDTLVELDDA